MNANNRKIIILANGDYPSHPTALQMLWSGVEVVCCDGAANHFVNQGGVPLAIIGDGDSLDATVRERFGHCVHHVPEQETNDLTKAVNYAVSLGATELCILGATGKRECHTLGNVSLLMEYHRRGLSVEMLTDYCRIVPCSGATTLTAFPGQQVSIINFGATHFCAEHLAYPIYDFQNWWQGTLNEATADSITIRAEGDYLVILDFKEA